MNPGDAVWVEFDGEPHRGQLDKIEKGWAHCLIETDWAYDYGSIDSSMSPQQVVAVRIGCVSPRD